MAEKGTVQTVDNAPKLLKTQDEIRKFLGDLRGNPCSKDMFYEYMKLGLPAIQIRGKWHAHTTNIHRFFIRLTARRTKPSAIPQRG